MATFTVTNTNNSGAGSLRQEILDANALTGKDIINFSGLFNDGLAHTISLTSSGLSITDNLTIEGTNPNLLTVKDDSATRVFDIASGVTAAINGLTITNSYKDTVDMVVGHGIKGTGGGGAISNEGVFTLNNSIITGNTAAEGRNYYGEFGQGGGIYNTGTLTVNYSTLTNNTAETNDGGGGGIYNTGTLTVNYSTLTNNTAETVDNIYGGSEPLRVYNNDPLTANHITLNDAANYSYGRFGYGGGGGIFNTGILKVNDSTISNNKIGTNFYYDSINIDYNGGGIYSASTLSAELVVNNSIITGNTATGYGGGIYGLSIIPGSIPPNKSATGSILVNNSNITGNTATGGGGIYNNGILTLNDSKITGNSAQAGGGIYNDYYNYYNVLVTVNYSDITGNSAQVGGGIFNITKVPSGEDQGSIITVSHSTISVNQAHLGGGIYNDNVTLTVSNSTIKQNRAFGSELSSGNYESGEGGGIYNITLGTTTLDHSTIACNFDTPLEDSTKFIKLDNLEGKFINIGSLVEV